MAAIWHYRKDGKQYGPVEPNVLKHLANTGQLLPTDFVWKPNLKEWVAASSIKGLFAAANDMVEAATVAGPGRGTSTPPIPQQEPSKTESKQNSTARPLLGRTFFLVGIALGVLFTFILHIILYVAVPRVALVIDALALAFIGLLVVRNRDAVSHAMRGFLAQLAIHKWRLTWHHGAGVLIGIVLLAGRVAMDKQRGGIAPSPGGAVNTRSPQQTAAKNTTQMKTDLKDATKAAVKAYFGRAPEVVVGEQWIYSGRFYDPDAEQELSKATILFGPDGKAFVITFIDL